MPRPSTIARLPPDVRELIGKLRDNGRTIDEILAKLRELDVDVSRSALGRHVKQLDAIGEELRRSRTVAEAIVQRFGDASESRLARLNIELMHSLVLKLLVGENGEVVSLEPQEAMFAASALQKLSQAAKQDVEREVKIREQLGRKVQEKIAAVEAEVTKDPQRPMEEVLQRIRQDVYGIFA